jgi:hypothetical protein
VDISSDPLRLLLSYDGATDPPNDVPIEVTEVAPEIVMMPFWTSAMCEAVIAAAEATGRFDPDPDDPVPGHEVSLATISPVLFDAVQNDIGRRVWPVLRRQWPLIDYHGLRDAFVIRYRSGEQESLRLHQDIAQVSMTVRLCDGYEGAHLSFPRQRWDNRDQPVGTLVAWPSLVTHPHEATTLESGVKYGLTIWCDLPSDVNATLYV